MEFTHFNEYGKAKMVSVGEKEDTKRVAIAKGTITMNPKTFQMVVDQTHKKGDVLSVAQVAGIMGAKKTSDLIPMCHPIFISGADIEFSADEETSSIHITATTKTVGKTGIEMEALTAVSTAALTIYDMCKAVDRSMTIQNIRLVEKMGGKSGHFIRGEE
ncbi:cyclic pyranopterin monophosphate synthase MoaC [Gottschalkiaceae bacterium SANA]|nr:cyclic pyranopterin monophosphate synthase MoaC [Gottschalkiaceae bacterium SANA]